MSTLNAEVFPKKVMLEIDGAIQSLLRVGPSFHGWIYRSTVSSSWYRLLPGGLALRDSALLRPLVGAEAAPGLARVNRAFPAGDEPECFVVEYDAPEGARALAEILNAGDPPTALEHVLEMLRALPGWWENLHAPLLPMPADVIFGTDRDVALLQVPAWDLPGVDNVFEEPERIMFLAPEYIRWTLPGDRTQGFRCLDLFCAGICLLLCFCELPRHGNVAELLVESVAGVHLSRRKWKDDTPAWMARIRATEEAIDMACRIASPDPAVRAGIELHTVAEYLGACRTRMDPSEAVIELRRKNPLKAFALLGDLLLERCSYKLLLLGGNLAEDLHRPLEAIDFYDRAINEYPEEMEAHIRQFFMIARARAPYNPLHDVYLQYVDLAARLDARIGRQFDIIDRILPDFGKQYELDLAKHYLWRGRQLKTFYEVAARFIHRRIHDERGGFLPWKLLMNVAYCEAMIELEREDDALTQLQIIENAIKRYGSHPRMDSEEVQEALDWAMELKSRIAGERGRSNGDETI